MITNNLLEEYCKVSRNFYYKNPLNLEKIINGGNEMRDSCKTGNYKIIGFADKHFKTVLSFSPLSTGTSTELTKNAARLRALLYDGYGMKPDEFPERRDAIKAIEAYRYHLKLEPYV